MQALCKPEIMSIVYLYLDPHTNDSYFVRLAASIIDRLEPNNYTHLMLFEEQFLFELVDDFKQMKHDEQTGKHNMRKYIKILDKTVCIGLRHILQIINMLTRSDSYMCILYESLCNEDSLNTLKAGLNSERHLEQQETNKMIKQLARHKCCEHANEAFLQVFLPMLSTGRHTKTETIDCCTQLYTYKTVESHKGYTGPDASIVATAASTSKCAYAVICKRYCDALKIKGKC